MAAMIFSTHSLHPDVTADLRRLGNLVIASEPSPTVADGNPA